MFCQYRDILGQPKQGIHKFRLGPVAAVDLVLTVVLAFVLNYIFKTGFFILVFMLLLFSIFVHKMFCVDTYLSELF